jgi:Hemerythrin HHE cation binding domain
MALLSAQLRKEHAKLMPHVDALLAAADEAATLGPPALQARISAEYAFLIGDFLPHMDSEQESLVPVIERLALGADFIRDAHQAIRELIEDLGAPDLPAADGSSAIWTLGRRRVLYQLFALLKTHLAEEEWLIPIVEARLSRAEETELAARLEFGAPPH